MTTLTPAQHESGRLAVMAVLYPRAHVAWGTPAIRRRLATEQLLDFEPSDEDLAAWLSFLMSDGLVIEFVDTLGSSRSYKITAKGLLAYERRGQMQ